MKIDRFEGNYWFLSNFYPCDINYKGYVFKSSEHAFQASKATNSLDFMAVYDTPNPAKAKKMGKRITIKENWSEIKIDIMKEILAAKFSNKELADKLLATGDMELIESNWWHDNFWGICTCDKCGNLGQNNLGKLLMELRGKLKCQKV